MDLNKALAEIAISGLAEGMIDEAESIISMLEAESISNVSKITLRALLLVYSDKPESAIEVLEPWCNQNMDQLDTPHAYLALALWRSGRINASKELCCKLMASSIDCTIKNMVKEVYSQTLV
ncbi:hypothetical protein [Microbulbifer sp. JMSA003]|uniref:hypothetical protein n=1 Tax=unclassified Microbulbifer TaxID=2619833 RepID=UPI0040390615